MKLLLVGLVLVACAGCSGEQFNKFMRDFGEGFAAGPTKTPCCEEEDFMEKQQRDWQLQQMQWDLEALRFESLSNK
jgi:hypothetical protein